MVTALIIAATAYICAWRSYRGYIAGWTEQASTRQELERMNREIDVYRQMVGHLPAALTDLDLRTWPVDQAGVPVDRWGWPLQYQVNGDTYDLYSLGRDGRPGGSGLDADLHPGQYDPETEGLTFWQFSTLPEVRGIMAVCILTGGLAFPILINAPPEESPGRRVITPYLIARHLLTAVAAVVTAVIISFLHLPSGH